MTASPPLRGRELRFESIPGSAWTPHFPRLDRMRRDRVVSGARMLQRAIADSASPSGFGALLARKKPQFPLDRAIPLVRALTRAFARDDADAVVAAALPLLGLGAGLTPSGDDLVGGALFGRRLVAGADPRWASAGRKLSREIRSRSHAVSAALFPTSRRVAASRRCTISLLRLQRATTNRRFARRAHWRRSAIRPAGTC